MDGMPVPDASAKKLSFFLLVRFLTAKFYLKSQAYTKKATFYTKCQVKMAHIHMKTPTT